MILGTERGLLHFVNHKIFIKPHLWLNHSINNLFTTSMIDQSFIWLICWPHSTADIPFFFKKKGRSIKEGGDLIKRKFLALEVTKSLSGIYSKWLAFCSPSLDGPYKALAKPCDYIKPSKMNSNKFCWSTFWTCRSARLEQPGNTILTANHWFTTGCLLWLEVLLFPYKEGIRNKPEILSKLNFEQHEL